MNATSTPADATIPASFKRRAFAVSFALACFAATAAAGAQTPSAPAISTQREVPELVSHPPLFPVQRAMNKTNLSKLVVTVEVQWSTEGRVSLARIVERTPSAAVEKAVLEWARGLRFAAEAPGKGLIPFHLRNDRTGGGNLPMPAPQVTRP